MLERFFLWSRCNDLFLGGRGRGLEGLRMMWRVGLEVG